MIKQRILEIVAEAFTHWDTLEERAAEVRGVLYGYGIAQGLRDDAIEDIVKELCETVFSTEDPEVKANAVLEAVNDVSPADMSLN